MVDPFMPKGKNRSCKRRKYFWTKQMSKASVKRGKLWKTWISTRQSADYDRYITAHRALQRKIKQAKRKSFRELIASLEDDFDHDLPGRISRIRKNRQKRAVRSSSFSEGGLNLESFTEYVANKFEPSPRINGEKFTVNEKELEADILGAILRSGRKKAAGVDNTFNDALRLDAPGSAAFLTKLWKCCGRIAEILSLWDIISLFLFLRKGSGRFRATTGLLL